MNHLTHVVLLIKDDLCIVNRADGKKVCAELPGCVSNWCVHEIILIHTSPEEISMKRFSRFVRFLQMAFPLMMAVAFCFHCDYTGTLVDPDEPADPLFTMRGSISEEIPDEYFTESRSIRIGLIPGGLSAFIPDVVYDGPESIERYMAESAENINKPYVQPAIRAMLFPSVSFSGEFPKNFVSQFQSLPVEDRTARFPAPSGEVYRIGIFGIALFEDCDKDGDIQIKELVDTAGYTPSFDNPSHSDVEYAPGSDRLIGVCSDYFIVYIEDAAFLDELNSHISEHIGAYALWEGLSAGFNLVSFTSEVWQDSATLSGIRAYPESTEVRIAPLDIGQLYRPSSETPMTLSAYRRLFYFQRFALNHDWGTIGVTATPGTDTIYLKIPHGIPEDRYSFSVTENTWMTPDDPFFSIHLDAAGLFDFGYYSCWNPLAVREMQEMPHGRTFMVNETSLTDFSDVDDLCDTIALAGDTVRTAIVQEQHVECSSPTAPLYFERLIISVQIPSGSPLTVIPVE